MRRIILFSMFLILSASFAFGQSSDTQSVEGSISYSNLQAEGIPNFTQSGTFSDRFFGQRTGLHGFDTEITGYMSGGLGVTGDFSFNTRNRNSGLSTSGFTGNRRTQVYNILGGPQYKWHGTSAVEPYVRALAGVAHTRFEASTTQTLTTGTATNSFTTNSTDFAMGIGGGLDVRVSDRFAIRAFQFDYNPVFLRARSINALGAAGAIQPFRLESQRQDNLRFAFGVVFR